MEKDLNKLIHLVSKEFANAELEKKALKELYEIYRIPFYLTALSIMKDEAAAKAVAAEAFKRIEASSYRFEEELNAQYWFFDVLYTLCINADKTVDKDKAMPNIPENLMQSPEFFIKIYTELDVAEISVLTGKKKSLVKQNTEKLEQEQAIKAIADQYCPDYWDTVKSSAPTGFGELSEKEKTKSLAEKRSQGRIMGVKRSIAIILVITLVVSAVAIGVLLVTKKFGSDKDKNEVNEEIVLQFNNTIAVTELNGDIYYSSEKAIYKYTPNTGARIKISDDNPKELLSDGNFIYYRNNTDGYMYRVNADGSGKLKLCDRPGAAMTLHENMLYFSTGDGIYRIPSSGADISEAELLLDISQDANLYCVDTAVHSSGNVFFASGIGKGVHNITDYKGTPSVEGVFIEEVYTIIIDGDKLYFDSKEASGKIVLYSFDIAAYIEGSGENRILPKAVSDAEGKNIELSTGAFMVKDEKIYFATEDNNVSVIYMLDEGRNLRRVTEIPSSEANVKRLLSISDIHVYGENVYYFCSDGKAGGDRAFFEYNMNTNMTTKIFES